MFSVLLRAALTFLMAPVLIWVWAMGMSPLVDVIEGFGVEESSHAAWLLTTIEWFPLIVLLSLIVWIINGALVQRRATRRPM